MSDTGNSHLTRRHALQMLGVGSVGLAAGTGMSAGATDSAGKVVFMYDDGMAKDYTKTFPAHQEMDAVGCIAATPGKLGSSRFLTESQLREIADAGWEILSHTVHHRPVGTFELVRDANAGDKRIFPLVHNHGLISGDRIRIFDENHSEIATVADYGWVSSRDEEDEYITLEEPLSASFATGSKVGFTRDILHEAFADSKAQLESMGFAVSNFVYPYGNTSSMSREMVPSYYDAVANGEWGDGLNEIQDLNPHRLHRQYYRTNKMSESELQTYFDRLVRKDAIGILAGHSYQDDLTKDRIQLAIQMARDRNIEIVTLREALTDVPGIDLARSTTGVSNTLATGQTDTSQWHRELFSRNYDNPVVVVGPVSENGNHPAHVRIRDVAGWGFEFQLEEWAYLDGGHTTEDLSYLAISRGRDSFDDGTQIEVGQVETDHTFTSVSFDQSFSTTPVVLTQSQTQNGLNPIVTRQRNVSQSGLDVRLQEEEANGPHKTESVGYIALEPTTGQFDGKHFEAGRTGDVVTNRWHRLNFQRSYTNPQFVATIQTTDGPDTAGVRYRNLTNDGVDVRIEEAQSYDSETYHTTERLGYFVAGTGVTHGEMGSVSTSQPNRETWHTISLTRQYDEPVVVAGPPSFNGINPMHPRIRRVTGDEFDCQLEEWRYLDGIHTSERFDFFALETGIEQFGGVPVEVGRVETDETFTAVSFDQSFSTTPVAFTQSLTNHGLNPVVTRQRNVSTAGMDVRLQEEEMDGPHFTETVGYAAFTPGTGSLDGTPFEVSHTKNIVTNDWQQINFERSYTDPRFIASIQTDDGPDTAGIRYRNLTANSVELRIEEEQSADTERYHTTERIGYLVSE
ncbi:polysaccharide deacetylase family protein [Halocatena halophila]|uniref:polysaccharide deacetylase family protein n=1 Tax=Halocatena halophila TaxID=2814576 RepID=UPI002ED0724D